MTPFDPRLLRHAHAARRYIVITTLTGALTAALVVAQASLIASAIAPVIEGRATTSAVAHLVGCLALVVIARVLVLSFQETFAHRGATRTKTDIF